MSSKLTEVAKISNTAIVIAGLIVVILAICLNLFYLGFTQEASAQNMPILVGKSVMVE